MTIFSDRGYRIRLAARISTHSGNDPKQVYRPKGMDSWVIFYTLSGQAIVGPPGLKIEINQGDMLLIPPNVSHDYRHASNASWKHIWCYFSPQTQWLKYLQWPEINEGTMQLSIKDPQAQKKIVAAFHELVEYSSSSLTNNFCFSMNLLERILLLADTQIPLAMVTGKNDKRIECARRYLHENFHKTIEVDELARIIGLSKSRLSVIFKEQTGQTLIEYLETVRIQQSITQLLMTNKTIQKISQEIGYENPFYFSRIFQKHMAMSPREFRKQKK